ncbi:MAG TPA: CHASE domain-containing protein, partial [Polyangiaceae bacterium]|nr:CHASE domain-containing protein [Polyangiaceae bacterium]
MDSAQPDLVSVLPTRSDATRGFLRDGFRSRAVWAVLALGAVGTLVLAMLAARRVREQAEREFEDRSRLVAAHVEQSFSAPLEALYGIHALGCALPDVDQPRFAQFASRLLERYPSLAALELFDVVRDEERDDFERRLSASLGYPFSFQEPASTAPFGMVVSPRRARHVVLTRLLPYNKQLHGLDISFDALRREQIAEATRAGTATVTEKFRLVEDPEGVFSVAVYDPLYADGQVPSRVEDRESELRGFAIALYRLAPLMRAALAGTDLGQSSVALVDRDPRLARADALLFGSREALTPRDFRFSHDLRFAGRAWTFVSSRAAPPTLAAAAPTLAVGGFGSLLLAVMVGLAGSLRASRRRFQALEALGPYTLLRELGGGGMGRVYEAQHSLLRRRAAIKVIAQEQASAEQLRRFDLEAKMTSRLCHPNTVVVFDYGRTRRGDFYYAM